jgi:hypothetical protein
MKALETGDYRAFGDAVNEEKTLIDKLPQRTNVLKPTRKRST